MSIYGPRSELDLIAVQRDDEALDELARRQAREPMGEDVLFLLSALTAEVDAGLADLLATPLQMPLRSAATGEIPSLSDAARRRTARAVTAALIVAGLASVSGVSAAVTGDPLTPYRNVISTVAGNDTKPAPRVAGNESVRQQVLSIDAAIDAGQFDRAHRGVKRLHATLDAKPRGADRAVIAQLAALEAKLARAEAASKKADDAQPPTLPAATNGSHAGGSGAPGQVQKPVDQPKSYPPQDKAKAPSAPRKSSAETFKPRQNDSEKPSTGQAAAESEAKSGAAANNQKATRE
ncbi:MAG: hypothetical protein ABJA93_07600 [Sporichthyaceae bacterium]